MEDNNRTPPVTKSSESPAEKKAGAGQDIEGGRSSEGSPKCVAPTKGSDVQEFTSPAEETQRRDQRDLAVDVAKSGTGTKETEGVVETTSVGTPSSSSKAISASVQGVAVPTAGSSNILSTGKIWEASETVRTSRKWRMDKNSFTVTEECLKEVQDASQGLRSYFLQLLASSEIQRKREMARCLSRDYKRRPEISFFLDRYQVVEDYFKGFCLYFPAQMDVTRDPLQDVKEGCSGGKAGHSEGNVKTTKKKKMMMKEKKKSIMMKKEEKKKKKSMMKEKEKTMLMKEEKRKIDSVVPTTASKVEGLAVVRTVEKHAEIAVKRTRGEDAGSSAQKEVTDSQTSRKTLSSSSFVPSEQDVGDVAVGHEVELHSSRFDIDAQLREIKWTCDFLLTSGKCVAFVVAQALKTNALCPLLLKLAATGLGEDDFKTVHVSVALIRHYARLALEAAEAAVEYHKSAASYLSVVSGTAPTVQVAEVLGEEVLSRVVGTAEQLAELDLRVPHIRAKDEAELWRVAEETAYVLSPALRRVKEADAFTNDLVDNVDRGLLHAAMGVTLKGATYHTLFVISEAERVLRLPAVHCALGERTAQVEVGSGHVSAPQHSEQGGTPPLDVSQADSSDSA